MRRFLKISLCVLLAYSTSIGAAQENEPHELILQKPLSSSPHTLSQEDNDVGYEEAAPVPITMSESDKPPVDNFGILKNGVIPIDIWKNTSIEQAKELFSFFRTGIANPDLRELVTNLLLAQTEPPKGSTGNNWLDARVAVLLALGQEEKLLALTKALPSSVTTPYIAQVKTELMLLHNEYDQACVHNANANNDVFWQKLGALCLAHAGKTDEVMLALDVMHESTPNDPFFQEAIRHINQKSFVIKSFPASFTVFDFALLRLSGETNSLKERLESVPLLALKYLANDTTIDQKLREKAMTRAVGLGIIAQASVNKLPEAPFAKVLASDVTTLVTSFSATQPINEADNAVIARLQLANAGIQDARRLQKLLSLMQIFGYKVPDTTWQILFARKSRFDGEIPPAYLIDHLYQSAFTKRRAEVVILSALIANANDMDKLSDIALIAIVTSLKNNGFEKEARLLAVSALTGYK